MDKTIPQLPAATALTGSELGILSAGGITENWLLSLILPYIVSNIQVGATVTFGIVLPQNVTGANGDIFFNTADNSIAKKIAGSWVVQYTFPAAVSGNSFRYGIGIASNTLGINGDSYLDTLTGIFYQRITGIYSQMFSMATGPAGASITGPAGANGTNGKSLLNGTTLPLNSLGFDGDFYLNTVSMILYGPKAAGAWGTGFSLLAQVYNFPTRRVTLSSMTVDGLSYNNADLAGKTGYEIDYIQGAAPLTPGTDFIYTATGFTLTGFGALVAGQTLRIIS